MNDFLGKELNVGDNVIYLYHSKTSSHYSKRKVLGFGNKKIKINDGSVNGYVCVYPDKLVKYEDEV